MKVVIAGATGLIGSTLARELVGAGHDVVALTRSPGKADRLASGVRAVQWDAKWQQQSAREPWVQEIQQSDAVVNLAGASIGGPRWTESRKRLLRASRVGSNEALVAAIGAAPSGQRPRALVGASGIDYYRNLEGADPVTESAPPGDSFLARLSVDWEASARQAESLGVRVVLMRTAVVIAREALAFRLLTLPFRFFAGGPLGSGRQWFTWVHLQDAVGLYRFAIERDDLRGPVNLVAPDARPQREVARAIGKQLRRPAFMPAPEFALRIALGESADLLLHGRRAVPERALAAGYEFIYPQLEPALAEALNPEAHSRGR
jgi:uncharacterized protein